MHDGWPVSGPAARALTRPLRREIVRALPERPFALRFWDGSVVPATVQGAPEFRARTPAALTHFLRSPGELGLGRAYVQGDLVADDLDAAFEVVDGWEPPAVSAADRIRLTLAAAAAAGGAGAPLECADARVVGGLAALWHGQEPGLGV